MDRETNPRHQSVRERESERQRTSGICHFSHTSDTHAYDWIYKCPFFNLDRHGSLQLFNRTVLSVSLSPSLSLFLSLLCEHFAYSDKNDEEKRRHREAKLIVKSLDSLSKDVVSPVASPMASYRNTTQLNSSNTNNNNNNTNTTTTTRHQPPLSATLNREQYEYSSSSSSKYHPQDNHRALTMPKSHYQNIPATTNSNDFLPTDHGSNYSTESSSFDGESNSTTGDASKRINSANAKFSIQKMLRQGFSSWRTRKKPPSLSTPPPTAATSSNAIYTNTPPSSQPSLSSGRYITNTDDLPSPPPPPTAVRSISVDAISTNLSSPPQRIIVTEPVTLSPARSNSVDSVTVDFDRPASHTRTYIPSAWMSSSTSASNPPASTSTTITTDSVTQHTPITVNRILPVQFTENTRIVSPRSPPPPPPSTVSASSTVIRGMEPLSNTPLSASNNTPNLSRIPPPGIPCLANLISV